MELWFMYALLSAILTGLFSFGLKIIAERKLDANLLTAMYLGVSSLLGLFAWIFFENSFFVYSIDFLIGIAVAGFSGILFSMLYIFQIKSLKYIDTTLYYPIFKTLTPLFVLILSIFSLKESLTGFEYLAVFTSLFVPLLLIDKKEKTRQSDLIKGLKLLFISVIFASLATFLIKISVDKNISIWLLVFVQGFFGWMTNIVIGWITKKPINFNKISKKYLLYSSTLGLLVFLTGAAFFLSIKHGLLSVAYTVQSIYILIPIILSIWFYKEHINTRKIIAIILSIIAMVLFQI